MPITPDDVDHVAELAHLSFNADEKKQLANEMSRILDYIDTLNELDTAGVPPMAHGLDHQNVTRKDEADTRISHEQALENAPDTDGTYVRVPRVIENS